MNETFKEDASSEDRILADAKLCERVVAGDPEAGKEFYTRYYRLAKHFGYIAVQDCRTGVIDADDLFQEAFMYMFESTKRYSPQDITFSTYTSLFMSQRLKRAVVKQYGAKVPEYIYQIIGNISFLDNTRLNNGGAPMTDNEIAEEFKILPGAPDDNCVTVGAIRQAMLLTRYIGSIDNGYSPHTEDSPKNKYFLDNTQQLQPVAGEIAPLPEEEVEAKLLRENVEKVLSTLSSRNADIIRMRFGFDGQAPKTFEQIAQVIGVTKERVRQIEVKILGELRVSKKCKELIGIIE